MHPKCKMQLCICFLFIFASKKVQLKLFDQDNRYQISSSAGLLRFSADSDELKIDLVKIQMLYYVNVESQILSLNQSFVLNHIS